MTEHATLVRVTTFSPADGRRQELIARLQQLATAFRQHDGCFGTQICTVDEQPDAVAVVSRWRDQASLDSLIQSNGGAVNREIAAFVSGPPTTTHLRTV